MVDAAELCAALTIGSISGAVGGRSTNIMTKSQTFTEAVSTALFGIFLAIAGAGGAAQAQTSGAVQPWGRPPLPAGVGPVEKFADVSNTPQGQFLEGGAFDTQGNLWFVAIGSGWV
jgi:hypothetical protein